MGLAGGHARKDARVGLIGDAVHDDRIRIIAILMNYPVYEGIDPTYNESRLRDGGSSPVGPAFAVSGLSSPLPPPSRFDLNTRASRFSARRRAPTRPARHRSLNELTLEEP
jgi:hypothetical protein